MNNNFYVSFWNDDIMKSYSDVCQYISFDEFLNMYSNAVIVHFFNFLKISDISPEQLFAKLQLRKLFSEYPNLKIEKL